MILSGLVALGVAELGLIVAVVPGHDLRSLFFSPLRAGALLVALMALAAVSYTFTRYPGVALLALAIAAPFRIAMAIGSTHARLLLPFYAVLVAALFAMAWRLLRGTEPRPIARAFAVPSAILIGLYALSLLWAKDVHAGTIELGAFLFPFLALVVVVSNEPRPPWLMRALVVALVGEAMAFAAFGLWEEVTRHAFFSPYLEVANTYSNYFRTNSLFYDPNIYGRYLVLALAVLVVLMWRRRLAFPAAAALIAFLWLGLYYAYSLSSLVSLFLVALGVTLVLGGRRTRRAIAVTAASMAIVGAGLLAVNAQGHSLRSVTSGRSHLASVTFDVFRSNPLVGVGVGSQPLASQRVSDSGGAAKKDASHTTPLTVAAELGAAGVFAYLAWLAGAFATLREAWRRDSTIGLALAAVFGVLFTHSLSYSGFFEDPVTWGGLALAAALTLSPGAAGGAGAGDRGGKAGRLPGWVRRKIFLIPALSGAVFVLAGVGISLALHYHAPGLGGSVTALTGVTVERPKPQRHPLKRHPTVPAATSELCWDSFGGDPARTLARPKVNLGRPQKIVWSRGLHDLMEYPPTFCGGYLYANLERGRTVAIDAATGRVLWSRKAPGYTASSPAIAGPLLFVSSHGGTVAALRRSDGGLLWELKASAPVESSPVVVAGVVYVGASDGRLYALRASNGKPLWIYNTGGRISASPSVVGDRVCITTYSGVIECLSRGDGRRIWAVEPRRDFLRYESFYASPSSDGQRIFTVARSGNVYALSVQSGRTLWTYPLGAEAYGTPSIANGRVFVADLSGNLHAFRTTTGALLWRLHVSGRILGPSLVVGNLVFFSTLEGDTYAARTVDGRIVWHIGLGKYAPGIATNLHYYLSLNGRLYSFLGQHSKS